MADDNTPAADNPYTQTYVVQSGDTLSKIAQKYYGDPSLYTQIFEANRDILKDPNKIFPGQKLKIP
jgi:nucleoid-associated protein YgaU